MKYLIHLILLLLVDVPKFNNKIKILKTNAFGFRNFKRFRNGIFHFGHQSLQILYFNSKSQLLPYAVPLFQSKDRYSMKCLPLL